MMKFSNLKQDKGVAGLTILLSLITMLFVIGLLIMIFSLMGGEMKNTSSVKASESGTVVQSNVAWTDEATGTSLTACAGSIEGVTTTIVSVYNDSVLQSVGNYTFSDCIIIGTTASELNGTPVDNVTYTYTYAGASYGIMNDTVTGIASTTDWFPIFIVIGAMVVLILLTVIIITAIRGSGLMVGSTPTGRQNIGSA